MAHPYIEAIHCTNKLENLNFCDYLGLTNNYKKQKLGEGSFGQVFLVKNIECDKFYALKCISRQLIVENQLDKHIEVNFYKNNH